MEEPTYSRAELLDAQGAFYQADPRWRKRFEELVAEGAIRPVKDRARHGRTVAHRYSAEEAYILAVLFKLRAVGLAPLRVRDVATVLHNAWDAEHRSSHFLGYWEAAKHGGEPESYPGMDRRAHIDPAKRDPIAPGTPCGLIVGLIPDDGRGFDEGELSVVVTFGSASSAPSGCEELRLNLSALFGEVKLPERQPVTELPRPPVGRAAMPTIPRHSTPVAAAAAQR